MAFLLGCPHCTSAPKRGAVKTSRRGLWLYRSAAAPLLFFLFLAGGSGPLAPFLSLFPPPMLCWAPTHTIACAVLEGAVGVG